MTYRMKAAYYTRQAWMHLGQARAARLERRGVSDGWTLMVLNGRIRDQAYFARQSMRCATLYRQIDGRL